jgi:hypothetical protein
MIASVLFGLAFLAVFAAIQAIRPGKSLFDRK